MNKKMEIQLKEIKHQLITLIYYIPTNLLNIKGLEVPMLILNSEMVSPNYPNGLIIQLRHKLIEKFER